jgi:hypothetical protein
MRVRLSSSVACLAALPLWIVLAADQHTPLFTRLDFLQRVKVLASLFVLLGTGVFLLLLVRAGSRIARWYSGPPPQRSTPPAWAEQRWLRKPRVSKRERDHWQKPE